jgi:outer membrane protein assembly factor BamB
MSSPVIIGEYGYIHLKNQRFACFHMESGEILWRSKPFGKYASLVASGDKILALDERGDLLLIKATPESFQVIDKRKVSDNSWAHLAAKGEQVFVRELDGLKVFKWQR